MVIQIDQLIFHNGLPLTFILSDNAGAEPVPLPSTALRENQGHEIDRFAAAQPRRWASFIVPALAGSSFRLDATATRAKEPHRFKPLLVLHRGQRVHNSRERGLYKPPFAVRLAPAIQNTMHKFFFVKHSSSYLGPRPTIRSSGPAFSGPLTLHVIP